MSCQTNEQWAWTIDVQVAQRTVTLPVWDKPAKGTVRLDVEVGKSITIGYVWYENGATPYAVSKTFDYRNPELVYNVIRTECLTHGDAVMRLNRWGLTERA